MEPDALSVVPELAGPSCDTCHFYEQTSPGFGKCHRYPPLPERDAVAFTVTIADYWCGEYRRVDD